MNILQSMYIDAHSHLDFYDENVEKAIVDINNNHILTLAMSMDIESYNKNNFKKYVTYKNLFGLPIVVTENVVQQAL